MRPVLLPLSGVVVSRALLFAAMTIFLPTFLTQEGAGLFRAGVSLAVLQGAGVVGALAGGIVSDRLGRRRVMLAMTIAAPLAAILFLNMRGWLQFPALLLTGLTLLSTTPVLMALVQERAPNSRAFANGIFMAINFATASLALLVIGALGDQFGLRPAFYISALVMLACTPFVWFLHD
jgi:MFS transporter, FSR family, fosmidomycin resistance protein